MCKIIYISFKKTAFYPIMYMYIMYNLHVTAYSTVESTPLHYFIIYSY